MTNPVVRSATVFWRQRSALPQTLVFFVTSRCNARCSFCLYWDQINDPVPRSRELTVAEVERIADAYGPLHYLALSGGEPFVRRDLDPLCQAFIDRCGTSVVDIPSNFWFTDVMVDTLGPLVRRNPHTVFDIQLSLDHLGARHDESRKVEGLYERALASFRALQDLRAEAPNLRLKVSIVWLPSNRDDLDEIVTTVLREIDPDRVQLSYPNEVVAPSGAGAETVDDVAAYTAAAQRVDEQSGDRGVRDLHTLGVRATKPVYHRLLADAVSGATPTGSHCEAGRWVVVIDEKGEVFPCEPLWQSVGNLREHDYDLRAVLEGPAYQAFRAERLGPDRCSCTWSCAVLGSISNRPRFLPELAVRAGKLAIDGRRAHDTGA